MESCIRFLQSMYQHAKGYSGLVQIVKGPVFAKGVYKVLMKTRGVSCQLKTENELQEMAKCVLTGLVTDYMMEILFIGISDYQTYCIFLVHLRALGMSSLISSMVVVISKNLAD